jgi:hypothetical protein
MSRPLRLACACLLMATAGAASAQNSIFSCVDAKGRRITADRPIPECADREQKELRPTGTVRRVIPPTPTAAERAVLDEQERKATEERLRVAEQKRLQKLLVARYPNKAAHDVDRSRALQTVDDLIATSHKRIAELGVERAKLDAEARSYKRPEQWPPQLKRQYEDNDQQVAGQQRFIAAQEQEKKRIGARFDEELARLKALWSPGATTAATEAPAPR